MEEVWTGGPIFATVATMNHSLPIIHDTSPGTKSDMQTILVVEDDHQIRDLLTTLLEEEGYRVVLAENGLQAIKCLSDVHPDLIICDVMMPILDGGDVANVVRATPDLQETPVLGVTALSTLKRARDHNFAAVIHKPFDVTELLETVSSLLNQAH